MCGGADGWRVGSVGRRKRGQCEMKWSPLLSVRLRDEGEGSDASRFRKRREVAAGDARAIDDDRDAAGCDDAEAQGVERATSSSARWKRLRKAAEALLRATC